MVGASYGAQNDSTKFGGGHYKNSQDDCSGPSQLSSQTWLSVDIWVNMTLHTPMLNKSFHLCLGVGFLAVCSVLVVCAVLVLNQTNSHGRVGSSQERKSNVEKKSLNI